MKISVDISDDQVDALRRRFGTDDDLAARVQKLCDDVLIQFQRERDEARKARFMAATKVLQADDLRTLQDLLDKADALQENGENQ